MDYMSNISTQISRGNQKALNHAMKTGSYKIWDSVKGKNFRRKTPRGKVFWRLDQLEWKKRCKDLEKSSNELEAMAEELKQHG